MNFSLIHHEENNNRLILIFAGWSTAAPLYADIRRKGWDTAVVDDYTDLRLDPSALEGYKTVYLYAWSLGVWAASRVLSADSITMAFAVNGTLRPVDDRLGIPEAIFTGTAENLDERNLRKFRMRMASRAISPEALGEGARDVELLRDELLAIAGSKEPAKEPPLRWRRAYIGSADRIFPPENQAEAWIASGSICEETITVDAPHYIPLKSIVDATIPDLDKVGKRFEASGDTYDLQASAQLRAAGLLAQMAQAAHTRPHPRMLEIGQGTGLFTRIYAPLLDPESIDFVDIYPTPIIGACATERYHVGDAETFIESGGRSYDMIVSASTIQWFRNLPGFIESAARRLTPGGSLVCSTFLPGTLDIFDSFRPSPMLYLSKTEILNALNSNFGEVESITDSVELTFDSAKDALRHLRQTGVGGAFGRFGSLRQLVSSLEADHDRITLRFNILCFRASSPLPG